MLGGAPLRPFGAGLPLLPGRVHHSPVVKDSSRGKSGPNGWADSSAFRNSLDITNAPALAVAVALIAVRRFIFCALMILD